MSKLINEPIIVHLSKSFVPDAFIWRKRNYKVSEILSSWWEPSSWWDEEPVKFFVRVIATNRAIGIYELCKYGKNWSLNRILD